MAADMMLLAGNTHGWESEAITLLSLRLETCFDSWDFPPTRLFDSAIDKLDSVVPKYAGRFFPGLMKTGAPFVRVTGDGNCLDNATLQVLEKTEVRAFEFRVRKGLHFVANLAAYKEKMTGYFIFEEELATHCRIYFTNYSYQSPEHDVAAADLIHRPIVAHYPPVISSS